MEMNILFPNIFHLILSICDIFNHHFISSGHLFDNQTQSAIEIVKDEHSSNSNTPPDDSFSLRQFPVIDVFDALASINPKQATGAGLLNAWLLVLAAPIITFSLTHISNLTIVSGIIPSVWKAAHVLPLHKGGDSSDPNNYRPISKLSCLATFFEKLIYTQLRQFLSQHCILNPHHSGFIHGHSTLTAAWW